MPTSVRLNLILRTSISRPASSYFAAGSPMVCQCKPVRHYLRMFILKRTKLLGPLDRQDHNGELQLLNHHHRARLLVRQETGVAALLRSTHLLSLQTHTISENHLEVLFLHHHASQVQDKSNR